MINRSRLLSLVCVAAGITAAPAFADAPASGGAAPSAGAPAWHGGHRHGHSEFRHVLSQLNLTPEQQTQIKAIVAQAKADAASRHADSRSNREALMSMSPNDPNYPAMLATEKSNAAARIQRASDLKTQIYAVLTPDQQARIPSIIAADRAAREAKVAAWRSQHSG